MYKHKHALKDQIHITMNKYLMLNVFGNTMHNHYESILFVKVKIKRAITSRNAKF